MASAGVLAFFEQVDLYYLALVGSLLMAWIRVTIEDRPLSIDIRNH